MAVLTETIFMIQLFVLAVIVLTRLYNTLTNFELWDFKINIVMFVGQLLLYGTAIVCSTISYDNLGITQLFKLDILMFWVANLLFVIEVIAGMASHALQQQRGRYSSTGR